MGLDQYFTARKGTWNSFGRWDAEEGKKDNTEYPAALNVFADYIFEQNFKSTQIKIDYQIGYFRKFNALHSYIVKNYADGVDECQDIWLTKKGIEKLLEVLKQVSEDHSKAPELLPTQSGFFFGSTEYDEYYFADVEEAIKLFEMIIANLDFDKFDLIYRASW